MQLTINEYDRIKKSVHYKRFTELMVKHHITVDQLIAIDDLVNEIKGYRSVKNAQAAKDAIKIIAAEAPML